MITEYLIREDADWKYTVSKWEGGKTPTQVYIVYKNRDQWRCNCPARQSCKHIDLVLDYIKKNRVVDKQRPKW